MTERTLRVLEFTKIRQQLVDLTVTSMGAKLAGGLMPHRDIGLVRAAQQETEEAHVLLTYLGGQPLVPCQDVREYLRLAEIGGTLSPRALLDVAGCMRASRAARDALVTDRENTPALTALASRLQTFHRLERDIIEAILSEEEIADHASPALADIRRRIRQCNERVREKLNAIIHSPAYQKYLQDAIITIRSDRFVLPVKAEHRASVPGLVHDQSATGATLFIEPMAVVEINNDLKQWVAKEKAEIERILQAFSQEIAPGAPGLTANLDILGALDFAFAKAALSRAMFGAAPKVNDRGYLRVVRGRHPLIDPQKVVPIDLWLGGEIATLVITGPNTGGKTVTLKTVGLLTLMAQAGLHVPADVGTELAVFDEVFADIGDEQSIEQSLSTFSSHMKNIVDILSRVTANSLTLFDELGAGTDPTEGAALAQAVLATLLGLGARAVATTHYSELKEYALITPGVENASVEFNVETLRPTYRLSIGIPGKSNAFEISQRLGLPQAIIDRARELLSRDQIRFEDVIANAEYHRQVAQKERQLAEEARLEMLRMREEAEAQRKKMDEDRDHAMRKAKEDARRVLENARQEAEAIVTDLKRMKKEGGVTPEHQVQALRQKLRHSIDDLHEGLAQPVPRVIAPPKSLKPGDRVLLVHLNNQATVLASPDAKGEVQVQAGVVKMKVHLSQLELMPEQQPAQRAKVRNMVDIQHRAVSREVDVRGMALDEAMAEVDKFLDDAVLCALGEVCIIHGKGTGTLRSGIQSQLRNHPHVKNFRLGRYGEGEDGVTVATLK
ncbi:MAG: endonuclease MutS2 [Oscillospiraceae bacterium]|jgi:DNA mismatch repair protein MutS2|nr:endonuclease MutS2 [Oscillospiraceae bacterium]